MSYKLKLKKLQQKTDLYQGDMAPLPGISLSTFRTCVQRVARITFENAVKICEILGRISNDLCGWYDSHQREGFPEAHTPEGELLACHRASTLERRERILGTT